MEISIHSLLEGATRATGTVAIIDVFRAFTTAAIAFAKVAFEGETLEVEDTGQVAESSIFEPEPENHR